MTLGQRELTYVGMMRMFRVAEKAAPDLTSGEKYTYGHLFERCSETEQDKIREWCPTLVQLLDEHREKTKEDLAKGVFG